MRLALKVHEVWRLLQSNAVWEQEVASIIKHNLLVELCNVALCQCSYHLHTSIIDCVTQVGFWGGFAGLVVENWRVGRHKHMWVSIGSDLRIDTRRDLDDVGAHDIPVHPLNKLPYGTLASKKVGLSKSCFVVVQCIMCQALLDCWNRLSLQPTECNAHGSCLTVFTPAVVVAIVAVCWGCTLNALAHNPTVSASVGGCGDFVARGSDSMRLDQKYMQRLQITTVKAAWNRILLTCSTWQAELHPPLLRRTQERPELTCTHLSMNHSAVIYNSL